MQIENEENIIGNGNCKGDGICNDEQATLEAKFKPDANGVEEPELKHYLTGINKLTNDYTDLVNPRTFRMKNHVILYTDMLKKYADASGHNVNSSEFTQSLTAISLVGFTFPSVIYLVYPDVRIFLMSMSGKTLTPLAILCFFLPILLTGTCITSSLFAKYKSKGRRHLLLSLIVGCIYTVIITSLYMIPYMPLVFCTLSLFILVFVLLKSIKNDRQNKRLYKMRKDYVAAKNAVKEDSLSIAKEAEDSLLKFNKKFIEEYPGFIAYTYSYTPELFRKYVEMCLDTDWIEKAN